MFETSVVRDRVVARRRYGLLTASLVAHSLVVAGVVAASLASISFPGRAPNELAAFRPMATVAIPPPVGIRRAAPVHAGPAAPPVTRTATAPPADTAPSQIPSTVVPLQPGTGTGPGTAQPGGPSDAAGGPNGDPNGDPNGIDLGQPAMPDATPGPEMTWAPGGEVHAARVVSRVEPAYPRAALAARIAGVVVVRCVIGKNGEVRDAAVVSSSFAGFEEPALEALRQWKFLPGSLHGKAVDTWFELTIRFAPR